jgi:hypothetical protein
MESDEAKTIVRRNQGRQSSIILAPGPAGRRDHVRLRQPGYRRRRVAGPGEQGGREAGALCPDHVPDVRRDHAAGGGRHVQLPSHHVVENLCDLVGAGRLNAELPLEDAGQAGAFQWGLPALGGW